MKRIFGKISIWAIAILLLMAFSSEMNAKPIGIEVIITLGHRETVDGKTNCVGDGICKVTIIIHLPWDDYTLGRGESISFPADAEVMDGTLVINFAKKLDKKYMYPEGTYTLPLEKDQHIEGKDAEQFGLKKFTIPKGQYKFDGQTLKIRLSNVKPLDKPKKSDGTE